MNKSTPQTIVECTVNPDKPNDGPAGHLRRCEFPTTDIQTIIQNILGTSVVHWCPPAIVDSQSPATTVFDPIALLLEDNSVTAAVALVASFPSQLRMHEYLLRLDKHFPCHMVDTSLSAIAYNACAVPIS